LSVHTQSHPPTHPPTQTSSAQRVEIVQGSLSFDVLVHHTTEHCVAQSTRTASSHERCEKLMCAVQVRRSAVNGSSPSTVACCLLSRNTAAQCRSHCPTLQGMCVSTLQQPQHAGVLRNALLTSSVLFSSMLIISMKNTSNSMADMMQTHPLQPHTPTPSSTSLPFTGTRLQSGRFLTSMNISNNGVDSRSTLSGVRELTDCVCTLHGLVAWDGAGRRGECLVHIQAQRDGAPQGK
jgi:hypothetical protein